MTNENFFRKKYTNVLINNRTYMKRMVDAERARRILANEDYKELRSLEEQELATLYHKLRDTITTDPRIAELQGKLKKLESVLSRPFTWLEIAQQTVSQAKEIEAANPTDSEDYESG